MDNWITYSITDNLSNLSNTLSLTGFPTRHQANTGLQPPAPKIDTSIQFDEPSWIDGSELFGLLILVAIAAVWWFFKDRK